MNIKRLLALGAMILGVGFFGASTAQAQVSTIPITRGGITCQKVVGGTYPEDGHIFRCTGITQFDNEIQNRPRNVMNGTWGTNANAGLDMKERFAAAGVEFYSFNDAIESQRFLLNIAVPTNAQKQTWFNQFAGKSAYSSDPADTAQRAVVAFRLVGVTGTYPPGNTTSVNITDFSHNVAHEMGHNYDFLSASALTGNVYPSWSTEFARVAEVDRAYWQAQDPATYPTDVVTYKYYFKYNSDNLPPPDKHWAELFSEDFAVRIQGTAGSQPASGADSIINSRYVCTRRYVEFMLINNRPPVAGTVDYNTARCR
jgi:hypothetical protein